MSHFEGDEPGSDAPSATFDHWMIRGQKLVHDPEAVFGPVCFAQYTLHRNTLKLTAQLTPVEAISGHRVVLEIRKTDGGERRARAQWTRWDEWPVSASTIGGVGKPSRTGSE